MKIPISTYKEILSNTFGENPRSPLL